MRLVNDLEFRLIVTFGYLSWNSLFSWVISAFCPPRTSWSQTVSVTGPAAVTFVLIAEVGFWVGVLAFFPGVQAAASTTTPTAAPASVPVPNDLPSGVKLLRFSSVAG